MIKFITMKIQFTKIKQNHQKLVSNSVRDKLNVTNIQSYYPIFSLFMKFYNNSYSHKCFMMKNEYMIRELLNEIGSNSKIKDGYIKFFYNCKLINNETNEISNDKVFIKMSPILDVLPYIMNEYNINHTSGLPNIFNYLANKKINSFNNSSYIDSFFSYLASNMFENKLCPTFPLSYGTFSGIAGHFDYDITEEYSSIKRQDWYDEYNTKLFEIIKLENDYFSEAGNSSKSLICDDVNKVLDLKLDSDSESDLDSDLDPKRSSSSDSELKLNDNKNIKIKKWFKNIINNSSNKRKRKQKSNIDKLDDNSNDGDYSNNDSEIDQKILNLSNSNQSDSNQSDGNQSDGNQSDSNQSDGNQSDGNQSDDNQSDDNQSDGNQSDGNQSDGNQSDDNQSDGNQSDGNQSNNIGEELPKDISDDLQYNDIDNSDNDIDNSDIDITNLNSFLNSDMDSLSSSLDNISEDSSQFKFLKYVRVKNFPVQLIFMEVLDKTLDELLDSDNYNMSEDEWISILFQICFGLSIAQKYYNFVHNDLHSSNIMFKNTNYKYLYFNINNTYYKIPTFGKITKIIDFGRATFKVQNKIFFSDVFKKNGDAEGQYSYPYHNNVNKNKVKTNPSFDLARLSTTIIERLEEDSPVFSMVKEWSKDRYGNYLIYHNDNFELYKRISKTVETAIPKNQLKHELYQRFAIKQSKIPKKEFVYYY